MKFIIDSKTFSDAAKRASAVCEKTTSDYTECLKISTERNSALFSATSIDSFVSVFADADTIENGEMIFSVDYLPYIAKITDDMTVETDGETAIFSNGKKYITIPLWNGKTIDTPIFIPADAINIDKSLLLDTFKRFENFVCRQESRTVMCGFNLYGKNGKNQIVACDGYHAAMRTVDADFSKFNKTIPTKDAKKLAKIVNKKREESLDICIDSEKKWLEFLGKDFTFRCRIGEQSDYIDMERIFSAWDSAACFSVHADELSDVCADDVKILKKENKPMYAYLRGEKMVIQAPSVRPVNSDVIDIKNPLHIDELYGFNPQYILDCTKVFDEKEITVNANQSGWRMTDAEGLYNVCILPIRIKDSAGMAASCAEILEKLN